MTFIRHYLTAEEIGFITKAMTYGILTVDENGDFVKDKDGNYEWDIFPPTSEFQREILKYDLVAKILIAELKSDEPTSIAETYDILMENAIDLYKEVENLHLVDEIVAKEFSVAKTVERTLNGIVAQIDETMKNFDPKAMLVELEKLKDSDAMKMLAKA
jgi:hypothetical protein